LFKSSTCAGPGQALEQHLAQLDKHWLHSSSRAFCKSSHLRGMTMRTCAVVLWSSRCGISWGRPCVVHMAAFTALCCAHGSLHGLVLCTWQPSWPCVVHMAALPAWVDGLSGVHFTQQLEPWQRHVLQAPSKKSRARCTSEAAPQCCAAAALPLCAAEGLTHLDSRGDGR